METTRYSFRWLVILQILTFVLVTGRPQTSNENTVVTSSTTLSDHRLISKEAISTTIATETVRNDKNNATAIGESIKMVASQLLQANKKPPPATSGSTNIEDTRTPPKVKVQQIKNKITTHKPEIVENSHAGIAVPMTKDEIEKETADIQKNKTSNTLEKESSTTNGGISTWILLSGNPSTTSGPVNLHKNQNKNDSKSDKTKTNESVNKKESPKPQPNKVKPKTTPKPVRSSTAAPKPIFQRRPIAIVGHNKSDIVASGSAVNENVMNKIKASVLASVQKNKNAALNRTTTVTTTTSSPPTTIITTTTTKKSNKIVVNIEPEITTKLSKPSKMSNNLNKTNKNKKNKVTVENSSLEKTSEISNSILESKQAEIELEVSTPAPSTVKKPKRTSNKRKKNKNRRRKPASSISKPTDAETKDDPPNKASSKVPAKEKPITTQIYNYLSREVMPSMGVGLVSLAGLVGLASYFLYPFSGVVRRAYDMNERKDDIYGRNPDIYGSDGGHTEVEMLDEVLGKGPGIQISDRNVPNPYAGQPQFRHPQNIQEQHLRYRNVGHHSDGNSFMPSDRVGQHTVDTVQEPNFHSENVHGSVKPKFSTYQQPQPVYKSPDNIVPDSNYSEEPTRAGFVFHENIADPIYDQGIRYNQGIVADTSKLSDIETLHLGVDDIIEKQKETGYTVAVVGDKKEPQFVVGNIPKELIQAVTPVTVPEHGPRSLRIRRDTNYNLVQNIEEVLKAAENNTDNELINEINETADYNKKVNMKENSVTIDEIGNFLTTKKYDVNIEKNKEQITIKEEEKNKTEKIEATIKNVNKNEDNEIDGKKNKEKIQIKIVTPESVTTTSTETQSHIFIDLTTKKDENEIIQESETTTNKYYYNDQTSSYDSGVQENESEDPPNQPQRFSLMKFIKNIIDFKIRLGIGLLQTTTESLARYFKGVENAFRTAARASHADNSLHYSKD